MAVTTYFRVLATPTLRMALGCSVNCTRSAKGIAEVLPSARDAGMPSSDCRPWSICAPPHQLVGNLCLDSTDIDGGHIGKGVRQVVILRSQLALLPCEYADQLEEGIDS